MNISFMILLAITLSSLLTSANTYDDPDFPISHCYHWLDEGNNSRYYLTFKYDFAKKNNGELTFYTTHRTSNGSAAGKGLYCAKTPISSSDYGDRVIRVDFVDDVVIYNDSTGEKHCGIAHNSLPQSECREKEADIVLYHQGYHKTWYVIKNPKSIKSWTSNSKRLQQDLKSNIGPSESSLFEFKVSHTIGLMQDEIGKMGEKTYYNGNARFSIKKILSDPEMIKQQNPISLAYSILNYNAEEDLFPSEEKKEEMLKSLFLKMMAEDDTPQTLSTLNSLISGDPNYLNHITQQFKAVDKAQLSSLNPIVVIYLADVTQSLDVWTPSFTDQLAKQHFKKKENILALASIPFKPNSFVAAKLYDLLPPSDFVVPILMTQGKDRLGSSLTKLIPNSQKRKAYITSYLQSMSKVGGHIYNITFGSQRYSIPANTKDDFENFCYVILTQNYDNQETALSKIGKYSQSINIKSNQDKTTACQSLHTVYSDLIESGIDFSEDQVFLVRYKGYYGSETKFYVTNTDDLKTKCVGYYKNTSTDNDYSWAFNTGSLKGVRYTSSSYSRSYNDGYDGYNSLYNNNNNGYYSRRRYSSNDVCGDLVKQVSYTIPSKEKLVMARNFQKKWIHRGGYYKVAGRFHNYNYEFYVNHAGELNNICKDYFATLANENISLITWSVNGSKLQQFSTGREFMNTDYKVCKKFTELVEKDIISEKIYEARRDYQRKWSSKKGAIKVTGLLDKTGFQFSGDNSSQIYEQCQDFYKTLTDLPIGQLTWITQDKGFTPVKITSDEQSNPSALCKKITSWANK